MIDAVGTEKVANRIVQARLRVRDIDESAAWYEKHFGYIHCWKTEDESDMKLEPGTYLFLIRVDPAQPVQILSDGQPYMRCSASLSRCQPLFDLPLYRPLRHPSNKLPVE